ncbi:SDR family NAD(P)-dependent oxidoreductase [Novosphingopyxis sp.]|uniref:SDR family NAD(P)-dependent oxidoreductase n=1 Tax=Novosphingopyxis sp. TaxID=2709690 RepID=UPI003B5A692B
MVDLNLNGRIALVTGGESGIGAACVAMLAAAGADVGVVYYKDAEKGEASAAVAAGLGHKAVAVQADISEEKDVENAFDKIEKAIGIPDILVNSAGKNMSGVEVSDMSSEQWRDLLATDLTGSFFTSRRFVRNLKGSGRRGAIINITSIHSSVMRAGGADYDAAKGGQTNLTKTLALEVAELGITVNAIAPGMILTPMNDKALHDASYADKLAQSIPLRRPGKPEDVAGVALFLASPAGNYITGSTVTIDGGLSLQLGQGA